MNGKNILQQKESHMAIEEFQGQFRFLSNFVPASVMLDGVRYATVEHAFQAAKTLDPKERELFQNINPAEAKKRGRQVKIREDWEKVKISVMRDLLKQKFSKGMYKEKLVATGNQELVEGNYWGDVFWGVCRGEGQNNLGKLLMEIRDSL